MVVRGDGRVGIGTDSPNAKLDVTRAGNGEIAVLQTSANRGLSFQSQSDTALQIASLQGSTNLDLWANTLTFSAGNTERMRIDSSGKVGIGTSSPASPLDVNGAIRSRTQGFNVSDGSTTAGSLVMHKDITGAGTDKSLCLFAETGNELSFMTNGSVTERMRIDSSGRVGIGTSSPSQDLHIREDSGDCNLLIDSANGASQIFFGDDESV
ncbi:MAG: hypothetical protein GY918_12720, partial [Gammaproteobacteria bacterium]|nr:hypothetical protein [Gammaproteobacteria bacterium]